MNEFGKLALRCLIGTFLLLLAPFFSSPLPSRAATVEVDIIHSRDQYPQDGSYPILFQIRISSPWYIHGTGETGKGLTPARILFSQTPEVRVEQIRFPGPEEKKFSFLKETVEVFSGDVPVRAVLVVDPRASIGKHVLKGRLFFQACSPRSCRAPEDTPIIISLTIAHKAAEAKLKNQSVFDSVRGGGSFQDSTFPWEVETGLLLALLGVFAGGLALNLTPCIYPLIPITVSYFGGKSGEKSGPRIIHGLLYMTGLAFTNSLLGLTASLSGGMFGSALQNPFVLTVVAGILLFLGLSFFGLWELRIPSGLTRLASKNFSGYFGTFFMGLTLGIVAAPCLGPFILGLLTYVGQKGDPFLGFLYFFVLSIGLGLPLSLLAVFSGALERLPMSGEWMVWIRKVLGWVLLFMAGYMVKPLITGPLSKSLLLAALLATAGLHLGWVDRSASGIRAFPFMKKGLGVVLIAAAIFSLLPFSQRLPSVQWQPYNEELIKQAADQKKPVILDFYADWCPPCKVMEKEIFRDSQVVTLSKHFLTIRVDLTKGRKELEKHYQIRGVPTIIFINANGVEKRTLRIEAYTGKEEVLKRMRQLVKAS